MKPSPTRVATVYALKTRQGGIRMKGIAKKDGRWVIKTQGQGEVDLNEILSGLGGVPINNDIGTFWAFSEGWDYDAMKKAEDEYWEKNPDGDWWGGPREKWIQANQDFMAGGYGKYFPTESGAITNARGYKRDLYVGKVKVHMKDLKPSGKTTRQLMFLPKQGQYKTPIPGILASKRLVKVG